MFWGNCNPFRSQCDNVEEIYSHFWYDRLYNYLIKLYEYTGAEFDSGELNSRYLEWVLMTQGYAVVFRDKKGKLRSLDCSVHGQDCYREPTRVDVNNVVLGNTKLIPNVNCVIIRNNAKWKPSTDVIEYYASLLGKVQTSLRVGLSNNRFTKLLVADGDEEAQQYRKILDDVDKGKHGAIVKKSIASSLFGDNGKLPVFSMPTEYYADKDLATIKGILNEFFSIFGVNSSGANMEKGERNLESEVHSNDMQLMIAESYLGDSRRIGIEHVNKMFGTNLSVALRKGAIEEDGNIIEE